MYVAVVSIYCNFTINKKKWKKLVCLILYINTNEIGKGSKGSIPLAYTEINYEDKKAKPLSPH